MIRMNLGINPQLPNSSGNKLSILRTKIKDENFVHPLILAMASGQSNKEINYPDFILSSEDT